MTSRVVITGIGVVSPNGNTRDAFWKACLEGRSGVRRMETPWVADTDLSVKIAAPITGFDPQQAMISTKEERVLDRTAMFVLAAATEAMQDAGFVLAEEDDGRRRLRPEGVDTRRLGTVIGSGIGGLTSLELSHAIWRETRSKKAIKRYSLPMLIPNAPAATVAIRFGARAECKALSTACAAGTMALGDAFRILERGEADVVLAGGVEGAAGDADGYGLLGFERLRTLSCRNDEPQRASRPFDRKRDGFVLGEGGAVLVLERAEHAAARGARAHASIIGYGSNCDAHSMLQLDETGASIVRLLGDTLRSADISASDVGLISAHGTSTVPGDRTEARALRQFFGSHCDEISVTALKSMTGHAIAGSGPLETAAAVLSLEHGILTPTINHEFPDPECMVNVVANEPQRRQVELCVKLSYGFGGHNACLVLAR